jgi:hypothetical protein
MRKPKLPAHSITSGNIFADLGLPNAEELLLKAQIVSEKKHDSMISNSVLTEGSEARNQDERKKRYD